MAQLQIPSTWVGAGYAIPGVCSRHGQPATGTTPVQLTSRPPTWAYLLILLAGVAYVFARLSTRRTVKAPTWPLCQQCRTQRTAVIALGTVAIALGVVSFCCGLAWLANHPDSLRTGPVTLVGLALVVAGVIGLRRAGPQHLGRAHVSDDGQWVIVQDPHPAFAAEVQAATARAQHPPA